MTDTEPMRILFVGKSWLGSCARSLREALARHPQVEVDDINEDAYFPKHRARGLRAVHRLLRSRYRAELAAEIDQRISATRPDVLMAYKGHGLDAALWRSLRRRWPAMTTVNVYPDCSPHAHGAAHRDAVGACDLVLSTKPFHPAHWQSVYGYSNACRFIAQGYDPMLHQVDKPPAAQDVDVTLVANCRPEYLHLMQALATELDDIDIDVRIGGPGWTPHRETLPQHWDLAGPLHGRSYVSALRSARICIAPVTREIQVDGEQQPGDQDSTRSYELAAAHCFFIHRRTCYLHSVYSETREVPMFDDVQELADHIRHFLAHPEERTACASRAHARAVPAYSLDSRANEALKAVREFRVARVDAT